MIAARRKYGEALSMVNKALQTPHMVTEDQTLLSVMLLGVYEVFPTCFMDRHDGLGPLCLNYWPRSCCTDD
jgi:hypothetical protein